MNLYEKMAAISEECGTVAKNLAVGFGNNTYKAVGEGDVLATIKPLEAKYKVYSYPASRKIVDSGEILSKDYNGEKKKIFMRIETVYRFVNLEDPKEFIEMVSFGDGVDTQDKAPGKAMTYSDKYCLLKAYKIQTGDDPDVVESQGLIDKKTKAKGKPKDKITKDIVDSLLVRIAAVNGKVERVCEQYEVKDLKDLTNEQYEHLDAVLSKYGV